MEAVSFPQQSTPGKSLLSRPGLVDWFFARSVPGESDYTYRLRLYQILAFSFYFLASFLNFLSSQMVSYIITALTCVALLGIRYLIDAGRNRIAHYLLLITVNISLFLLVLTEGMMSGTNLYYSAVVISFSFISLSGSKEDKTWSFGLTAFFYMATILLFVSSMPAGIPVTMETQVNFLVNMTISFCLILYISYILMSDNGVMQRELVSKHEFLETIFNSSLHAEIIVHSRTGIISDCNVESDRIFSDGTRHALKGSAIASVFAESSAAEGSLFHSLISTPGESWCGEKSCIRTGGVFFPAQVSMVSFRYDGDEYKKITIVDITERHQILEDLRIAKSKAEESSLVKTQFLSQMSHELRTPLNGIIGTTNLMLDDALLPHQHDHLNVLKYSSEHMLGLINDILDLSKLEADKIQLEHIDINLIDLIQRSVSVFRQQFANKGLSLVANVDPSINFFVGGDSMRLNQVLANLLSNALKFTQEGKVAINVKLVSTSGNSASIHFSVEDTGIGISRDKQSLIFEQFSQADTNITRQYGGTGLGLTISQKLINLMGGNIGLTSKPGIGSCFYFLLSMPMHGLLTDAGLHDRNSNNPVAARITPGATNMNVLVAEDNMVNMMIVTRFLDKWGIRYTKACNGEEAVQKFRAGNGEFDLLLLDLDMPEKDGYMALKDIRNMNSAVPAVAFTATVMEHMKDQLANSGFNDYVQKPFKPEMLRDMLLKYARPAAA